MKLFEDGDPFFAPMLNALFAAFRGTAVMSGCETSATGTSRTVSITAGSVQINGEVIAVGAGSVTLDAGSTFDRYDLVSVDASGSKIVTKGTTKRKCPTQPANTCLLAIVFVPAGATVVTSGNVYDARLLASRLAAAALRCSTEISGAAFTPNVADMVFIHRPDPNKNPGNIVASDLSEVSTHSESFVLAKTLPAAPATGYIEDTTSAVKVSFEICSGDSDPRWRAEVEIRVGDEVRGGPIQGPSRDYVERSVDVEVQPGEVLTIWLRTGHSIYEGKVRNVKIYSMRHPLLAPSVAW